MSKVNKPLQSHNINLESLKLRAGEKTTDLPVKFNPLIDIIINLDQRIKYLESIPEVRNSVIEQYKKDRMKEAEKEIKEVENFDYTGD